jgi:large subunit ribosomal protein L22e
VTKGAKPAGKPAQAKAPQGKGQEKGKAPAQPAKAAQAAKPAAPKAAPAPAAAPAQAAPAAAAPAKKPASAPSAVKKAAAPKKALSLQKKTHHGVKKQQLKGKGQKKKKVSLKYIIDCTHPYEDKIMDVGNLVSIFYYSISKGCTLGSHL